MLELPCNIEKKKIQTTSLIANALNNLDLDQIINDLPDVLGIKISKDFEQYEDKECDIPNIIYDIIKRESTTSTKFVKRSYIETDAWLVSIEQRESECLDDNGYDVYTSETENFVKIHAPKIFVKTLSLPMIYRNH